MRTISVPGSPSLSGDSSRHLSELKVRLASCVCRYHGDMRTNSDCTSWSCNGSLEMLSGSAKIARFAMQAARRCRLVWDGTNRDYRHHGVKGRRFFSRDYRHHGVKGRSCLAGHGNDEGHLAALKRAGVDEVRRGGAASLCQHNRSASDPRTPQPTHSDVDALRRRP